MKLLPQVTTVSERLQEQRTQYRGSGSQDENITLVKKKTTPRYTTAKVFERSLKFNLSYQAKRTTVGMDLTSFKDDIARIDLFNDANPEKLVDLYNNTLRLLLDRHAPIMSKKVLFRPKIPWINSDIIKAKRQRRKAERKWRTTRCQSDLILFKKSRNYVTFLMNKARQDYYSDLISNNSNDLKHLFKVSKNLLNIASAPVLPPHEDKEQLANEMGAFFIRKIANIRCDLDNHPPQVCRVGSNDSNDCKIDLPITKFNLLSQEEVHDLIHASNKKTCCLDPIPTKLVLDCLDILLPVITKIINYSLEHGVFPSVWKNALVFPLLKKDGLESIFKNYRPVSNLQFISKLTESAVAKQLQHHINISLQCRRILGGRNLVRVRNVVVAAIFDFMTVEDWGE